MTQQHPITPPPNLFSSLPNKMTLGEQVDFAFSLGAAQQLEACHADIERKLQEAADKELEACCEWIPKATPWDAEQLRAARRPKPPSLKEQALALLNAVETSDDCCTSWDFTAIRRALEQLPDNE